MDVKELEDQLYVVRSSIRDYKNDEDDLEYVLDNIEGLLYQIISKLGDL